ncbi:NtaA/DmoA family FMN-dependent monooxygenase [Mycolicibacterium baixiangningiae]|uniref:NtaA/DmoA family FMN-dependent monooxygenase n=1 Tax=Mycolicibacterium baixiangningiae TaxID=2761578 RepID=UPI0018D0BFC6|nr:NtaA/DmoA family FMN-dependent monooxygenase [Mycolicibacterium baixiangningiae]
MTTDSAKRFRLAWFLDNHVAYDWGSPFSREHTDLWADPAFFVDLARSLERARFDYILVEDTSYVPDNHNESYDAYLTHGLAVPKLDAVSLMSFLLNATTKIGVVGTLSTTEYLPYHVARVVASLDHLSGGRAGWNIVTGISDRALQNYGQDRILEHDARYAIADEFVELVQNFWNSWDADAVVKDRERNVYVDPAKVHEINFKGEHFAARGPSVVPRPLQGKPLLSQAGGSPAGRSLAAKYADSILGIGGDPALMKEYRDDVRNRMAAGGRNPDECKVMFLGRVIVASTMAQAEEERQRRVDMILEDPSWAIALLCKDVSFDFGQFDPDDLLADIAPKVTSNGAQSLMRDVFAQPPGVTLRQYVAQDTQYADFIGTPESIADNMQDVMERVGGDGFVLTDYFLDRRGLAAVTDGLIPELRRRGLVQADYAHDMARPNLLAD